MLTKNEKILNFEGAIIEKYEVVREYDCITMDEYLSNCRVWDGFSIGDCYRIYNDLIKWEKETYEQFY